MGKQLVIAEKASVARDIAKALGGFEAVGKAYESDRYVISPAQGHLLELVEPESDPKPPRGGKKGAKKPAAKKADEKSAGRKPGKWNLESLPVVPERFELRPIKESEERLREIRRQLRRDDIDGLINACDAGREGELIFHNILLHLKEKRPVRRLWLQSMTPKAIREGFENLLPSKRMVPLQRAAVSRAESDWLVGINSTRALTALNSPKGSFNLTTVGRVQTPTLALIVDREKQIRAFKPRDYWEISARFAAKAGTYDGKWIDPGHKPGGPADRPQWILDSARAEEIAAKVTGKAGVADEEKKAQKVAPPMLFDLTSLQRAANRHFGFSARSTLSIAQALYESRAITYPRTDSRRLPEDYPDVVREALRSLSSGPLEALAPHAAAALERGYVRGENRRIFDNSKISDHFAIIPTGESPNLTREQNAKLYHFIAAHFIAAFYPPAKLEATVRRTVVEGETFESRGRVVVDPGWMAVTARRESGPAAEGLGGEAAGRDDTRELVAIDQGEQVDTESAETEQKQTRPPKRYNEATLLSAMEDAGKHVEDEELRESLKERGLGTPATRASIIEGLVREKYVARSERELVPSQKAFTLMDLLGALKIDVLTRAELTGEWERKLKQIENVGYSADEFMDGIRGLTRQIVDASKRLDLDELDDKGREPTGVSCPSCGKGEMGSGLRNFRCGACGHMIKKAWSGHELSAAELSDLVARGRAGPFDDFFSVRTRRNFSAALVLNEQKIPEFELGERAAPAASPEEIRDSRRLGACPACGEGQVLELPPAYACERSTGDRPTCKFRISRKILQREISPDEMGALLADKITGVLSGFVSKRTHRPFAAKLKLEPRDGGEIGLGFEFDKAGAKRKGPPRPARKRLKAAG